MTKEVRSWHAVDRRMFEDDILPAGQPAVLRGLADAWPLVRRGLEAPVAAAGYLKSGGPETEVELLLADPATGGRFFYYEAMSGPNFTRWRGGLHRVLDELVTRLQQPDAAFLSVQALPVAEHLPRFAAEHPLAVLPPQVQPRLWIGNAVTVAPHFDTYDNIACMACGRRRFLLFPPEQLANLYIGPLESTLQGQPISLVDMRAPDFERFPRYRDALAAAQVAELGPGDAIFIPYMWWHGVQSLSGFNVLANYWWNGPPEVDLAPMQALLHAIATIGKLRPEQRRIWAAFFDHYVVDPDGSAARHLPPERRGVLGEFDVDATRQTLRRLARTLEAWP